MSLTPEQPEVQTNNQQQPFMRSLMLLVGCGSFPLALMGGVTAGILLAPEGSKELGILGGLVPVVLGAALVLAAKWRRRNDNV